MLKRGRLSDGSAMRYTVILATGFTAADMARQAVHDAVNRRDDAGVPADN